MSLSSVTSETALRSQLFLELKVLQALHGWVRRRRKGERLK